MEFTSLRYFFETVKAGSIRQAAEHIHVAPSAISRQIAKLEHELGAALFERRSTGVRLTPAGEILAGQLQSTVRDLMRVRGQIDELNGLRRGDVTIHCIEGLIDTFLPAVIAAFNSRYPEIRFHVTVASTDGIIDALVSDDADIGIALNAPGRMEISVCGGWAEPLHAIVAPSHPLSARKGLHLAELARFPAALPDASFGVRRLVDRILAKGDLTPNVLVTTNSILATNCIVRQGIAYTLMPVFAVAGDLESGSLIAIPLTDRGLEPTRVQVCIHKNRRLPVAAAELLASLIASLPNPAKAARRPTKSHPEGIARAPSGPGPLLTGRSPDSSRPGSASASPPGAPHRSFTISAMGITQIFAWGSSFYLLAVLADPIAGDTGWPLAWVIGGVTLGLLVSGLISPRMGQAINRSGGRSIMALSSVLLALGLLILGGSPSLPAYLVGWVVIGLGMGTGLYDAAFATLARAYGNEARAAMTALTLIAGFSSTVCWPLAAALAAAYGWRITCLFFAVVQVTVCLPLHLTCLPRSSTLPSSPEVGSPGRASGRVEIDRRLVLLALAFTLVSLISAVVAIYLIVMLRAAGVDQPTAVWLATLLGPAQVAARLVELGFGRHYHPIWTLTAATSLTAVGLALVVAGGTMLPVGVALYGAGTGIAWVARGTVPLAVFGPEDYGARVGWLARPSLIAQALAPLLGAYVAETFGTSTTAVALLAAALLSVTLSVALARTVLSSR